MLWTALLGTGISVLCYYCRPLLFPVALLCLLIAATVCLRVSPAKATVVFLILCVLVCNIRLTYKKEEAVLYNCGRQISGIVEVIDAPRSGKTSATVTVRLINATEMPRGTRLRMRYSGVHLTPGDRMYATLRIDSLSSQERADSFAEQICGKCQLRSHGDVFSIHSVYTRLERLRQWIRETLLYFFPPESGAVARALLIGDRSGLSDQLIACVRGAGVSHVLVVSGLHFSILIGGAFRLIERFFFRRVPRFFAAVTVVLFFCALCGFTVSVLRAGFTFIIAAGSYLVGRDNDPISALGTAVTLILLISPFAVFSISFQLSVLSTAGVLIWFPALWGKLSPFFENCPVAAAVAESFTLTLCAMFLTLPVTAWHFGILPVAAPLTNLLISFPITVALLCVAFGLLLLLLPFGKYLAVLVFFPARICLAWFIEVVLSLGSNPHTQIPIPRAVTVPAVIAIVLTAFLIRSPYHLTRKEHRS